jgi:F0F1-type ATP synthase membrane subunit b/b'
MTPVLDVLTGTGSLTTSNLVIEGFPLLDRLAERLDVNQLRNPGFIDMQAAFDIRDGRMFVRPFDVTTGPLTLGVSGSNGMDRSLDYRLVLRLPSSAAGPGVARALPGLAALAGRAGMEAADVEIGVLVGGSVQDPSLSLELRELAGSVARGAEQALRDRAAEQVESATERADQAAAEARQRAREEAARLVEAAETRAEQIRAEARELAERVRQEGRERGDSLVVRAGNPAARLAAQAAADRVRREADAQADRMVAEADQRAADVVAEARRRAADVEAGGEPAGEHMTLQAGRRLAVRLHAGAERAVRRGHPWVYAEGIRQLKGSRRRRRPGRGLRPVQPVRGHRAVRPGLAHPDPRAAPRRAGGHRSGVADAQGAHSVATAPRGGH